MKIQSVCHLTGIEKPTLLYYERMGILRNIKRDPAGHREYDPGQLDWIALIKRLRATGMPMEEIQRLALLYEEGDKSLEERCHILKMHRDRVQQFLRETEKHLKVLEEKIQGCEEKKASPKP